MSEPKLITPLLSGHYMGDPISEHHGIRCCPALDKETEEKYIVKIISIPASQRQLDALLLSGAYSSAEEAREYFRRLAADTEEEAKTLQKLSKLEGFWGCDGWQTEPSEDGNGFDVYLLTRYGRTLESHLRRNCLTHLSAVNLGLDLCAALSVCRRSGWLYVNLKPENIFLSDTKGFLIGDLGFQSLRSLKYASLPDKYRSAYTAPEIGDAYATLNTTLDIYAMGRILSMVFNGGVLPEDPAAAPQYADADMTEILRKACAEDPADRWQDPEEMAQALVAYMQSHTVNDVPVVPIPEPESEPEIPAEEPIAEELPAEDFPAEETVEEVPVEETVEEVPVEESDEISPEDDDDMDLIPPFMVSDEDEVEEAVPAEPEIPVEESEEPELPVEESEAEEPEIPAEEPEPEAPEDEDADQFVIAGFLYDDDLLETDAAAQLSDDVISDEVTEMLAQADALIAMDVPDPVVAPEAIDVPMPEPIPLEPDPEPEPEIPADEPAGEMEEQEPEEEPPVSAPLPEDRTDDTTEDEEIAVVPAKRRKTGCLIGILVALIVLVLLGFGAKFYYDNIYLQPIHAITVDGSENWLTVTLDTDTDNTLLTVTCTDTYGNRLSQPVVNNQAKFTSLPSGSSFRIDVVISGWHQLTGTTTASYTSDAQTTILNFNASIGRTDGSVNLSFSVDGPDSAGGWIVQYSADGSAVQSANCTGHSAAISDLEVGKTYTFTLVPVDELYLVGGETTQFTAIAVILPQNLTIHGFQNNELVADWTAPEGTEVNSWTVRCYSESGYDQTFQVTEPAIRIPDLDISAGYTLEVKADGMLEGKSVSISANSVTFKDMLIALNTDDPTSPSLDINWTYEGTAPADGWILRYSVDNSQTVEVICESPSFVLEDLVPGGLYSFEVILPEDVDNNGCAKTYEVPDAGTFSGYWVVAAEMDFTLCLRPDKEGWSHKDVVEEDRTSAFTLGDSVGIIVHLNRTYDAVSDPIEITYILRSADGTFLRMDYQNNTWLNLWYKYYCELDLPVLPDTPGDYTLEILFNGAYITTEPIPFTVSEVPTTETE